MGHSERVDDNRIGRLDEGALIAAHLLSLVIAALFTLLALALIPFVIIYEDERAPRLALDMILAAVAVSHWTVCRLLARARGVSARR